MGRIRHMLGARKITPYSGYKHFVMEAAENIHIHWRDTRIQIFRKDFKNLRDYITIAYDKFVAMGEPLQDDRNINLGDPFKCTEPGFFCDRMTIEEQEVGGIHIHWRDTRVHADYGHFSEFATMVNEAYLAFKNVHRETVQLSDLEYPAVADTYIQWLIGYTSNKYEKVNADKCVMMCMKKNKLLADNLPVPDELDKKILFSIYESILKYGYASGPFYGDYTVCWRRPDGSKYMAAAHRWAALKTIGYKELEVCTILMPEPEQVREQ